MPNRRDILKHTCSLALGILGSPDLVRAAQGTSALLHPDTRSAGIRAVLRRDDTILRLGGLGDSFEMTWESQNRQYLIVNDGTGWAEKPKAFYDTRLWTLTGHMPDAVHSEVRGYPEFNETTRPENIAPYFGHGLLAVQGRLVQFLSTLDRATDRPRHWVGSKLIYSDDSGRTWCNQDGSSPVVWEDWKAQSRERLTFFQEPDECFSLLSILQMGRDYSANRDGYVYVYGLNGCIDGRMNELMMFRVPITQLLNRQSYEYFGGRRGNGGARWVKDIQSRAVVHTFPRGWVNRTNLFAGDLVVESWLPSIVYNEPLGLYLMISAGIGCAADGTEFGKPSYLGVWVSSTPDGPWSQVHEEMAWTPAGDSAARAYAPRIAPQSIAPDGRSLWLVWSDLKGVLTFARDEPLMTAALDKADSPEKRSAIQSDFIRRWMPGFSFNAQRVDLIPS